MTLRRRAFLGAGAAAAASFPFLRFASTARAGVEIPKRVVFFHAGSGAMVGHWEPLGAAGAPMPTETSFALNGLHQVMSGYERDMLYIENLDMLSRFVDPTAPGNAHFDAETHSLAANNRLSGTTTGSITIDQFIAREINREAPLTRLPSVFLTGQDWFNGDLLAQTQVATGPGELVEPLWHPVDAYERLFPASLGMMTPESDALAVQRGRTLDFVRGRYGTLAARLGSTDRARLEQHADALASLRARLAITTSRASNAPDRSIIAAAEGVRFDYATANTGNYWRISSELNVELAAAALHADVTRVITLCLPEAPGPLVGYTPGQFEVPDLHELSHAVNDPSRAQSRDPEAVRVLRESHAMAMQRFRQLIDALAARTEVDGSRLLDHTVVVFCSQIANGSHATDRLPWFLVGSCSGYFRTGRFISHGRTMVGDRSVGRPHNDLFVSVANAMDVPITEFGNADVCTGPIAELR